tara:strand:+ start:1057 stop:1509 length:453 start_codon:yes stop_codon:yes gene_type:complete
MDNEDLVKLVDGRVVKIKSLPTSFMANGSYEVLHSESNVKFWVKPEDIMYIVDKEVLDDVNNYFEVIWDEDGLNLIPKDFSSVDIESDREDFNRIKLNYDEGRKHRTINIHIGDKQINDKDKITIRPKKKKKSKIKKIINILKNKKENYE